MTILGTYIEEKREARALSVRQLSEKSGISHTEIHRLENGERKSPSPHLLKALAPQLGVTYEEIMQKAGYLEEVIEHEGFTENVYRDAEGNLVDIYRQARQMYDKDNKWANLAFRVTAADLSDTELEIIKTQTESLLEQFLKNKKK